MAASQRDRTVEVRASGQGHLLRTAITLTDSVVSVSLFRLFQQPKLVRKLLIVRSPQVLKLLLWFLFQQPRDVSPIDLGRSRIELPLLYDVAGFAVKTGILVLMISFFVVPMLRAQETVDQLRDLARNPVGDAIKVPFVESINFDAGPYDRTSNSLQVEPVIPW